jgi:DNA polymerase III sliding clamp (beta) subunit (PCNA family)
MDILKAAEGPVVEFNIFDHGGPCLFRAAADDAAYFVLMPARI